MQRDDKTERCLKENGYTFRYNPHYQLARINFERAKDNPARLRRAWDQEHSLRMGMRMEQGYKFPALVVFASGQDEDELATGLHRWKAADTLSWTEFAAYEVVEPDTARRAILPLLLNSLEGKANTRLEAFFLIFDCVQHSGMKADALCKELGEPYESYLDWAKLQAANERAQKMGVANQFAGKAFNQKLRLEIHKVKNDNTFAGLVDTIYYTRSMEGQPAQDFIREVRRHGTTEAVAQRMMEQRRRAFAEEEAERKPLNVRTPTATSTKYMGAVNKLRRFRKNFSVQALQLAGIPEAKRRSSLQAVRDLQAQLDEVAEALEALCEQTEREIEWRTNKSRRTGDSSSDSTSPPA